MVATALFLALALTIIPSSQSINNLEKNPQPTVKNNILPFTGAPTGTFWDHVVIIIMENEGIQDICRQSPPPCSTTGPAPFMAKLANNYTIGSQYLSLIGTSQPNYIGLISGSLQGCTSGGCPVITAPNLVDRFEAKGLSWNAYMEDQTPPAGCDTSSHGFYENIHNPFVEFQDITNNTSRCNKILRANPSGCGTTTDCKLISDLNNATVQASNFIWLTPNDCDNMHAAGGCTNGCTSPGTTCITAGDNYLKSLVPNILNSRTFTTTRSVLFITFDEGNGFCPLNGSSEDCIYASISGPVAKTGFGSSNLYNHYSWLKTVETNWNLSSFTSNDANARAMTEFFKTQSPDFSITANPSSLTPPVGGQSNSTITLSSISNFTSTVALTATSSPTGPSLTLIPSSVTVPRQGTATSTLTFSTSTTGNYTITIKGVSGSLVHNTTITASVSRPDFTISANPSTLTFGQLTTTAGPSVTAASTSDRTYFESSYLKPSFYAQGLIWLFYEDSQFNCEHQGGCLMYITSTNGTTWSTPTNVGVHITDSDFSVYTNGTSVFYARYNETTYDNTCARKVQFGLGALSTSGTAVWRPEQTVLSGVSNLAYPDDEITVDSTGQVWIGYMSDSKSACGGTGTQRPHVIHSAGKNYNSWTGDLIVCVASCTSNNWHIALASLGNGQLYALYWLNNNGLFGRLYNGVSWGSEETVSTDPTDVNSWLFNTGTRLYAIYFDNNVESYYFASRSSSGAWTSSLIGLGESHTNAFSGYYSLPDAAAYDARDGLFDLFYMNMTTQRIDQWSGHNSTWTRKTGFVNISTVPYPDSISSFIQSSPTLIGSIFYIGGSSSPFNLNSVALTFTNPGNTGNVTTTVTGKFGFTGTVNIKTTVSPSTGLTTSCIPASIAGGSGTSVCTLTSSASGNYTVTLTGTSGSLSHNSTVTVRVLAFPDFTLVASAPAPVDSSQSSTSTTTISGLNGFTGAVTLTDIAPIGLTCGAIMPSTITGSGSAVISCSSNQAGNYTLTITGKSGSLSHNTTAIFHIQDFNVTASPPGPSDVTQPVVATMTLNSMNHFNRTITLTDMIPSGLTCSPITPSNVTGLGTVTTSCSSTTVGNYTLTITGTSGSLTHTTSVSLTFQDFTMSAISPITAQPNVLIAANVTITGLNGFQATVVFADSTPSGLNCGAPTPVALNGTGTISIICSTSETGDFVLNVTGTNGPLAHTVQILIRVQTFAVGGVAISGDKIRLLVELIPTITIILTMLVGSVVAGRVLGKRVLRRTANKIGMFDSGVSKRFF